MKKAVIVEVEWVDIETKVEGWVSVDVLDCQIPPTCFSVGYLHCINGGVLKLYSSCCPEDDGFPIDTTQVIPVGCIVSVTNIATGKKIKIKQGVVKK